MSTCLYNLQVQQLVEELSVSRQQLQTAASNFIQAQEQIVSLHTALLQKTAIAEAAQAQLAAAALMQDMQQVMADAAAPAGTAHVCDSLAAAIRSKIPPGNSLGPAPEGATQSPLGEDPKVQRIQQLRAALAAALEGAANTNTTAIRVQNAAAEAPAAQQRIVDWAPAPATASGAAKQQVGADVDPKLQRIHELVAALTSAAADAADGSSGPAVSFQLGAAAIIGAPAVGTAAEQDAKAQRIHELRAALAEALEERDNLKQQLAAGHGVHNSALLAGQQIQQQQHQLLTGQVRVCSVHTP